MRVYLFVLLTIFLLAGCGRSADPLDWKIEAADADELDRWTLTNLPLMPPELGGEVASSINNIRASLPGSGIVNAFALCKQVDGRSVRAVVIKGYEIADDQLRAKIQNEAEALLRLAQAGDSLSAEQMEKRTTFYRRHRESMEKTLGKNEERLAALRTELQKP